MTTPPAPPALPKNLARDFAREHLQELLRGGALEKLGIELDLSRFESDLLVLAKMPTRRRDGSLHPDGPLYLLFDFRYYRLRPPVLRYVNPETWQFDPETDGRWLPLTPMVFRDMSKQVKFWRDHDGGGQLICHSLNAEYYWRGGHNAPPECRWNGDRRFPEALFLHDDLHRQPFYRGRNR
jgi:hypothetical protein